MNSGGPARSAQDYVELLRRQRAIIVLAVVCALAVAAGFSLLATPRYSTSAQVRFSDPSEDQAALGVSVTPNLQPEKFAAAQGELITSPRVAERAARALGGERSPESLLADVTQSLDPVTNLVVVRAEASSGAAAARLANTFANQTVAALTASTRTRYRDQVALLRKELDRTKDPTAKALLASRIAPLTTLSTFAAPATVVNVAEAPDSPSSPRTVRNLILALFIGLLAGAFTAFVRESLDRRVRSSEDVREYLDLPLLGIVPQAAMGRSTRAFGKRPALADEDLEPFRMLRTSVDFLAPDRALKTILVTSAMPEEGKSTVSSALAEVYAASGKRTMLIEADLRRPSLSTRLGLSSTPGLSDHLAGNAGPQDILRLVERVEHDSGSLVVLPAGTSSAHSGEMLGSPAFAELLREVSSVYDVVVIDTSPLLSVVDTRELVPLVDGVLICVRASQTTYGQAEAALRALHGFPDRPIGLVVTGVQEREEEAFGYYSYAYTRPEAGA